MSNDTQQVVNKVWNFAHVLRDDGLSFARLISPVSGLCGEWDKLDRSLDADPPHVVQPAPLWRKSLF